MPTPALVATIKQQFSDPAATAALETAELFWLSTGAGEQKMVNLRPNQHVVLTTGRNQWDQGLAVEVEGDAVQVTDDAVLERVARAFTARWDGRCQYTASGECSCDPAGGGEALVFSVT
jgi:Pyridoxamine 5'-phosphate oxidase